MSPRLSFVTGFTASLVVMSAPSVASGKKWYTAANGLDYPICGTSEKPCRSISRAIDLSLDGDTIVVGPGVYSTAMGETGPFHGSGAVVSVNKAVHVLSTAGAERTIIRGPSAAEGTEPDVVDITADGAQFGAKDQGFTVTGGDAIGVYDPAGRTIVSGNIATGNPTGFSFESVGSGQSIVQYNSAIGARVGFFLGGRYSADIVLASYNSASGGSAGFVVSNNAAHVLVHNTSVRNLYGIIVEGGYQVLHNTIEGSATAGIAVECPSGAIGATVDVSRNAIIANGGVGITIDAGCDRLAKFHENNIYANAATLPIGPPQPMDNCGLVNNAATKADAINNFWGAATGPGSDPADQACGNPSTTKPFATTPLVID